MAETTRRDFMAYAGAFAAASVLPFGRAEAMPLGLPPGLQLYAVREDLARDFAGTLRALRAMGYRRVEAAGWGDRSAADFRAAVTDAGLDCISCHYSLPRPDGRPRGEARFRPRASACATSSSPRRRRRGRCRAGRPWAVGDGRDHDARRLAGQCRSAEPPRARCARRAGFASAITIMPAEFLAYDNVIAFHELARLTDPALGRFRDRHRLGGRRRPRSGRGDPPSRRAVRLLHVKDIATKRAQSRPHRRRPDYRAGRQRHHRLAGRVRRRPAPRAFDAWFVEQEPPFTQPPLEAMRARASLISRPCAAERAWPRPSDMR